MNILFISAALFLTACAQCRAQHPADTNLYVIASIAAYQRSVQSDSNMKMIAVESWIPEIVFDLRYGTKNNFMHRVMYPEMPSHTFLRLPAVKALQMVQHELESKGLGLKIYDGYRPYSVTKKFWELVHDERYVADPRKGSGHNRGVAVDLTIIDLKTKMELPMPTGFDNFTDSAHHDFDDLPHLVLDNRKLLKETMKKYGFLEFPTEWWHYSLPNPDNYAVLDLPFAALDKQ